MKQKERSSLKKKIKNLFSLKIRSRDGKCLRCGSLKNLQASHVKSVGAYPHMQFDLDNCITLCRSCHIYFWHKEPDDAIRWFESCFPGKLNRLRKRSIESHVKIDLIEIYKSMK